jgi:protoheme IX farnesyltransferase
LEKINNSGSFLNVVAQLGKVRISFPVAFTTFTGYVLSHGSIDRGVVLPVAGIFLLACSASSLNQIQEMDTDLLMKRTRNRPLPAGRIGRKGAWMVTLIFFITGFFILYTGPGLLTTLVGLTTLVSYNLVYTPLKRVTAFAAVPGSIVGALPPLAGWVAGGGELNDPRALMIGFFFFIGQIPHFWLLLLKLGKQYESASLPSLTRLLSEEQIKRLTFIWIAAMAIAAMAIPAFKITVQQWSTIIVILLSVGLVLFFTRLLNRKKEFEVGKSFILINLYYLVVMLIMISDRLTRTH